MIPVNIASNNKTQVQVTSSAPDKHTALLVDDYQSTSVKTPETEELEDNKEKKEKLEDNKEKLEDNKNPVTSESTVSSNVPKKNENLASHSGFYDPIKSVFSEDKTQVTNSAPDEHITLVESVLPEDYKENDEEYYAGDYEK